MQDARWITGARTGVLIEVPPAGLPTLRAWGAAPGPNADPARDRAALVPAQGGSSVDARLAVDLLPRHASGFQGSPGLQGAFLDGTGWAPACASVAWTWLPDGILVRADDEAGLRLHVEVRLDSHDVLTARAAVTNLRGVGAPASELAFPAASAGLGRPRGRQVSGDDFALGALRVTLPVPDAAREVGTFTGRWLRELHLQRQPWHVGRVEQVNTRGRSSAEDPPLLLVGSAGFSFEAGLVWALHLAWSGNAELRAERTADGFAHLQAGEHLHPGEVTLRPGETYVTPMVLATASQAGLNGVSDAFHGHVRARRIHPERPRPITLNTWEALYFDHDPDRLRALVDVAAEIGVERFVLDDGWFAGRRDDTAGLGDWTPDPQRYPDGLAPLADLVRERGMEFGLWVEPEMVNPDSDLYRADPSVALTSGPTMRNQHVLDIARDDLADHLRERLGALVAESGAAYLKWDCNREHVAAQRDGVAATHAHVVALYALLDDLLEAHPELEVESCAGGGGRIDLGILARAHRVWTSDCNDPVERMAIQLGAALLLPPELLGSHVGPPTAHTTGRTTSLPMRLATAFFGHLGIEWDVTTASDADRRRLAEALALHRRWRDVIHSGRVVRVDHPDEHALVHAVVTPERALVWHMQLRTGPWVRPSAVRCPGLEPDRSYRVEVLDALTDPPGPQRDAPGWYDDGYAQVTGRHLADHGIALHVHQPATVTVLAITSL